MFRATILELQGHNHNHAGEDPGPMTSPIMSLKTLALF